MSIAASWGSSDAELLRLDWRDAPEIGSLLNRVWEQSYGASAHPRFSTTYLEWLYGGPRASENLLLGMRLGGRLIAFKALLSRGLVYRGRRLHAHLSTHLTVDPDLDIRTRLGAISTMTRPHSFVAAEHPGRTRDADVVFAFYDDTKTILRNTARLLDRFGLKRSTAAFNQSIVNPIVLEQSARSIPARPLTRSATRDDEHVIREIFAGAASRQPFAIDLGGETLLHHLFDAPHSCVHLAARDDGPAGVIAFSLMDTIRLGRTSRVVVVEFLLVEDAPAAVSLLQEALAFARESGAKGVVIENATCLDPALQRACGIMPSARRMTMAAIARAPMKIDGGFLTDVK